MLADDHDRPLDPEGEPPPRPRGKPSARRFDRLVRAGRSRRLSPRRLAVGTLLVGAVAWGGWEGAMFGSRRLAAWVGEQPEHQIRFDAIELTPAPPPFIRRGAEAILRQARAAGDYPETVSVLRLDADRLRGDLARSDWIESVGRVRRSHGRLSVAVAYREPIALMVWPSGEINKEVCVLVDRRGVELPVDKGPFDWQEDQPKPARYVPRGGRPLVLIRGLGPCEPRRMGQPFVPVDRRFDARLVQQAVDLAAFLQDHRPEGSTPELAPEFPRIWFDDQLRRFWLFDPAGSEVCWGAGPGAEGSDEPRAAEKWTMLQRFLAARGGSLKLRSDEYLALEHPEARLRKFSTRSRSQPVSEKSRR